METYRKENDLQDDIPIIICGDFNTFKSDRGIEQIETTLNKGNYKYFSENSMFSDGVNENSIANSSFCFYPYDFGIGMFGQTEVKELITSLETTKSKDELFKIQKIIDRNPFGDSILDHVFGKNASVIKSIIVVN